MYKIQGFVSENASGFLTRGYEDYVSWRAEMLQRVFDHGEQDIAVRNVECRTKMNIIVCGICDNMFLVGEGSHHSTEINECDVCVSFRARAQALSQLSAAKGLYGPYSLIAPCCERDYGMHVARTLPEGYKPKYRVGDAMSNGYYSLTVRGLRTLYSRTSVYGYNPELEPLGEEYLLQGSEVDLNCIDRLPVGKERRSSPVDLGSVMVLSPFSHFYNSNSSEKSKYLYGKKTTDKSLSLHDGLRAMCFEFNFVMSMIDTVKKRETDPEGRKPDWKPQNVAPHDKLNPTGEYVSDFYDPNNRGANYGEVVRNIAEMSYDDPTNGMDLDTVTLLGKSLSFTADEKNRLPANAQQMSGKKSETVLMGWREHLFRTKLKEQEPVSYYVYKDSEFRKDLQPADKSMVGFPGLVFHPSLLGRDLLCSEYPSTEIKFDRPNLHMLIESMCSTPGLRKLSSWAWATNHIHSNKLNMHDVLYSINDEILLRRDIGDAFNKMPNIAEYINEMSSSDSYPHGTYEVRNHETVSVITQIGATIGSAVDSLVSTFAPIWMKLGHTPGEVRDMYYIYSALFGTATSFKKMWKKMIKAKAHSNAPETQNSYVYLRRKMRDFLRLCPTESEFLTHQAAIIGDFISHAMGDAHNHTPSARYRLSDRCRSLMELADRNVNISARDDQLFRERDLFACGTLDLNSFAMESRAWVPRRLGALPSDTPDPYRTKRTDYRSSPSRAISKTESDYDVQPAQGIPLTLDTLRGLIDLVKRSIGHKDEALRIVPMSTLSPLEDTMLRPTLHLTSTYGHAPICIPGKINWHQKLHQEALDKSMEYFTRSYLSPSDSRNAFNTYSRCYQLTAALWPLRLDVAAMRIMVMLRAIHALIINSEALSKKNFSVPHVWALVAEFLCPEATSKSIMSEDGVILTGKNPVIAIVHQLSCHLGR